MDWLPPYKADNKVEVEAGVRKQAEKGLTILHSRLLSSNP
jgi:hypothetical protein